MSAETGKSISRRRLLIGAGLITVVGLLLAGCGVPAGDAGSGAGSTPPSEPTGILKVGLSADPNFIDPSTTFDISDFTVARNIFDGLVEISPTGALIPSLATEWSSNEDATEWIFTLREGVKFHDGEPLDSSAVKATAEYYAERPFGGFWHNPTSIDTSDPLKVRFTFDQPAPDFARDQAIARIISPRSIAKGSQEVESAPVGAGPFKFESWQRGTEIVLVANEDYWGEGPYLERIEFTPIADSAARFNALQSGAVDLIFNVDPTQAAQLGQRPDIAVASVDSWVQSELVLNVKLPGTKNVDVRRAIGYAIDRESIVDVLLDGSATVALSPVPTGTYGYAATPTQYTYSPEKAREILASVGEVPPIGLEVSVGGLVRGEEILQTIAQQLRDVGLEVDAQALDSAVINQAHSSGEVTRQGWLVQNGWLNGGPVHFTNGNLTGHAQYSEGPIADLADKVSTTADGPERESLMAELQEAWMTELPALPMYQLTLVDGMASKVKGYESPIDGYMKYLGQTYIS